MIQVHDKYGNLKTSLTGIGSGSVVSVQAGTGMDFPDVTVAGFINLDITKVPYYPSGFSTGYAKWDGTNWIFDNSIGATPTLQTVLTTGNFLTKTKAQIDTLILADGLIPLMTYEITGVNVPLYGGNTIYVQAINSNTLSFDGVGKFFNPKYNKAINGFGIWKDYNSYAINSKAIWGGKLWNNLTGVVGSSLDIFNLDATNWEVIGFNAIDYNVSYDKIKYDYVNDLIVYRNEQNSNIVSSSKENIDYLINQIGAYNPIAGFQFGNVYDGNVEKGIVSQIVTNSYNENINFKGSYQQFLTFDNGSIQSNLTFDNGSIQSNLTFDNGSIQSNLTFDNGSGQSNLTFDNGSIQSNLTFDNGSIQRNLSFDNGSYQQVLTFDNNSSQQYLTFDNVSYQNNLTFDNGSGQYYLTFDNGSGQSNLTFDNSSGQNNLTFDNGSIQRNLSFDNNSYQQFLTFDNGSIQYYLTETTGKKQEKITFDNISINRSPTPMVANEIGLNFKGTLPTATTPTTFLVKEGNQVKEIAYTSGGTTNLSYTPSATDGTVNSDTGTDATLPLATGINAGLLKPADFTQLSTLATDLSNKVTKNANITATTKTKITYDAKGLVTAGVDATTADIAPSTNRNYVTDAQQTSIGTIGNYLPLSGGTLSGDVIQPNLPTNAFHLANKNYIDNAITGLTWKTAVKCSTTANQTLSGTSNVDGVTIPIGTRILARFQTDATQNGIYTSAAGSWTRSTDADTALEVEGITVFVQSGTLHKNTQWTQNAVVATLGTDAVVFAQVSGAGTYTNGSGLDLTGNAFSIPALGVTNAMLAGSIAQSKVTNLVSDLSTLTTNVATNVSAIALKEDTANKQTDLTASATKFPTVNAVNTGLATKENSLGFTPENVANKITAALTTSTTSYPASSLVKSVTDANATAIATKQNEITATTSADIFQGDKTFVPKLGLPISTATQTALNTKRTFNRVTFSNANATIASTTRQLSSIVTLTAPRTVTLPLANTLLAGEQIIIIDENNTINGVNNIVIACSGGELINGVATETILMSNSGRILISNGVDKWSFDAGVVRQTQLSSYPKRIVNDVTTASVTGVIVETLAKTFEITTGTLSASGFLDLSVHSSRSGASNGYTVTVKINSTNNPATAIVIASSITNGNFAPSMRMERKFTLKSNLIVGLAGTLFSDLTSGQPLSVACNNTSSSVWIFVFITPTSVSSTVNIEGVEIKN